MLAENRDDDCFVCFDLMCEPSKTPCGHYLCVTCLQSVLIHKRCCPFCRTPVNNSYVPEIDKIRQKDIKTRKEAAFKKRMEEIKIKRLACDTLTLAYGNIHKRVQNIGSNTHAWTAYVRLADSHLDITKYIKKVVFTLHPTFSNPVREVLKPPFQVSCRGWGVFMIPIEIHWQPWLEKKPTRMRHFLSFYGEGEANTEEVKFNKSIFQSVNNDDDEDEGAVENDECDWEI